MVRYVSLNAASGNIVSTPDSAALGALRTSFTVIFDGFATDWTPAAVRAFWTYSNGTTKKCAVLGLNTNGRPYLEISTDGSTSIYANATAATPFVDGRRGLLKVARDTATGNVKFYTSPDGGVWTQLGTTVASTAGTLFDTDSALQVSMVTTYGGWAGGCYSLSVLNGYDGAGSVIASMDPLRYTGGTTFTSVTGEVWTLSGTAAIVSANP